MSRPVPVETQKMYLILLNFQWGFQCLPCKKRTKVSAVFLCLWIWTRSLAYPMGTLAHFRVTCIAPSIYEVGWQLWRDRFKSLFVWWSTRIWIADALIFCLQNMRSYHGVAQLKHRRQCLLKEERKILKVVLRSISRAEGKLVVHQLLPKLWLSDHYFYYITSARST